MKTRDFLSQLDEGQIEAAIAEAEARTSGEIRVWVSSKTVDDPVARATARFDKIGMRKTRERNAVLIYFAPASQKFAVIGDTAIHEICGQSFWEETAAEIHAQLVEQKFTDAVVGAVRKIGHLLANHFPPRGDDRDELSNTIVRD